jgi:hypothetical protein
MPGILSRYSALQIKVDKRFSQGYQLTGAYSLLALHDDCQHLELQQPTRGLRQLGGNPKHRLTFSGIWELPKFKAIKSCCAVS